MKRKKISPADIAFNAANYFLLTAFFLLCIYPFYYVLIYSLSDPILVQKGVTLLPVGITLENYIDIFKVQDIPQAALISLLRTVIGTVLTVVCSTFFAYLVTKDAMYFRKAIYRFLVATMYFSCGLIPGYLTMKAYHLNNNFLVYIVPGMVSAYYIVLLKTFIEQLPASLEESVKIDGGGIFTIFTRIIFPLSMPIIATIAVFSAVSQWNDWFTNYIFVQKADLQTLQLILYKYLTQTSSIGQQMVNSRGNEVQKVALKITPAAVRMTITMVVTLPIIFVYPFMQNYFVKGIMLGAIKG